MSEIMETDLAWVPPPFPAQGRLPTQALQVGQNCHRQNSAERLYRQELCLAAGRRVGPPCCKTLHISLFFDGTGNNLNNDLFLSDPKHPTNIARLFRATIGAGTAGGVPTGGQSMLLDDAGDGNGKYFKFYIPGVGTPFPEVNDPDYSTMGLVGAARGEERINWALLRIIDVLMRVSKDTKNNSIKLSEGDSRRSIEKMGTSWNRLWSGGSHSRYEEFSRLLNDLAPKLKPLIIQPEPGKPKLLGIKLYVYGFSRGAAAARTFVRWLSELLPPPEAEGEKPPQCLQIGELQLPVSVEFLGLLDTVASVGVAHVVPIAEGHMSWADDTMELPDDETYGGLIKKCVHLVSGHEQRLCFPLDSVRRSNGKYPPYATEVVYPGMHSDIGGGYPPGDQGKANGEHDGLLLSQIILQDLYSSAFEVGAPLKVPQDVLPESSTDNWRIMPIDLISQFLVSDVLIKRFNAWRELTLNLTTSEKITPEEASRYEPPRASGSLETVVENQIAWITAWRIDRYARGSVLKTPFYQRATNTEALPAARQAAEKTRDEKQRKVLEKRQKQKADQPADKMDELILYPGIKDFDPDMAQTQLSEAAKEFGKDYHDGYRIPENLAQVVLDTVLQPMIFVLNTDDEPQEYRRMKAAGDARVALLFPAAGEASNAERPAGLVRALFDDQVHDSRAWFMHAALGTREMWSGYFRYRMIYFSDKCNKSLSPLVIAGDLVGFASLATGIVLSFRQKRLSGKLAGLAATGAARSLQVAVLDRITREPVPELPGGERLRAFTREPGIVVAQQKVRVAEQQLARAQAAIPASWLKDVLTATA